MKKYGMQYVHRTEIVEKKTEIEIEKEIENENENESECDEAKGEER